MVHVEIFLNLLSNGSEKMCACEGGREGKRERARAQIWQNVKWVNPNEGYVRVHCTLLATVLKVS